MFLNLQWPVSYGFSKYQIIVSSISWPRRYGRWLLQTMVDYPVSKQTRLIYVLLGFFGSPATGEDAGRLVHDAKGHQVTVEEYKSDL